MSAMILRVKTDNTGTSGSNQFTLPLNVGETYNFNIDWGEGPPETITNVSTGFPNITHTYISPGTYDIYITQNVVGGFPTIFFNNIGDKLKLLQLSQWGTNKWITFNNSFNGCTNLVITATDEATANTGSVTNFGFAWQQCTGLTSFPLINTSSGTDFTQAWFECTNLASFPLIVTSAGTQFKNAWNSCTGLTSFPLINTSQGINFSYAWLGCTGLTSFPLLDTSLGTDFSFAWQNCTGLTSFPLINTSSGTDFTQAWFGCSHFTSFPLINTSNGTTFMGTWRICTGLTSFPLLDTSAGTNFRSTWRGCTGLISFSLLDTSLGTDFSFAWNSCTGLTSFPLINISLGANFSSAWFNCTHLISFPLLDTSAGTNFNSTWRGCTGLTSFPAINTSSGTDFSSAWRSCTGLTSFSVLNLRGMTLGANCFNGTTLPTSTYSAILIDLAANNVNTGVTFHGGSSKYNSSSASARTTLTVGKTWTITDGGLSTAPVADFTADHTSGTAPLTVQFTDTSTNTPTSWSWSFGDTGTSTVKNPQHIYSTAGTYTVALTATNAGGSDTETKIAYITVTANTTFTLIHQTIDFGDAIGCPILNSSGINLPISTSTSAVPVLGGFSGSDLLTPPYRFNPKQSIMIKISFFNIQVKTIGRLFNYDYDFIVRIRGLSIPYYYHRHNADDFIVTLAVNDWDTMGAINVTAEIIPVAPLISVSVQCTAGIAMDDPRGKL